VSRCEFCGREPGNACCSARWRKQRIAALVGDEWLAMAYQAEVDTEEMVS
jgi:hypothetical protein